MKGLAARIKPIARTVKRTTLRSLQTATTVAGLGFDDQARFLKRTHTNLVLVRWVKTSAIARWSMPDRWPTPYRSEFFVDGEWDLKYVGDMDYYRENSLNYRSTLQIFAEHVPYEQSDQFVFLKDLLKSDEWHPQIDQRGGTLEAIHAYFADLAVLFEVVKLHGFQSQDRLGVDNGDLDEIRVMIDREGRLVRVFGGNHRFAIAQILNLPRIPVYVIAVHRAWARKQFESVPGGLVVAVNAGLRALEADAPV